MAIYLKNDKVKGSSTNEKFKDQIELNSFQWGAGLGVGSRAAATAPFRSQAFRKSPRPR